MNLTLVKKKMPDGRQGYAIRNVCDNRLSLEEICRKAGHGLADRNVIEMVVKQLAEEVCYNLRRGLIVDLGPLGRLQPGVRSGMKENPEDFTWRDAQPTVNIIPSQQMRQAVKEGTRRWFKSHKKQIEQIADNDTEPTDP